MTDKLSEDELLSILETAFSHLLKDINYKETKRKYEQAKEQIVALIKSHPNLNQSMAQSKGKVTEEWIEDKAKGVIKKSFKDYETELQAILFVDPIRKSSYRKINKATDALGEQIWGFIRSLVKEIVGK